MDALFLCGVKSLENTAFELVVFRAEILKCSAMQSKSLNKKPESITHFNPIPITTMKTNQTDKATARPWRVVQSFVVTAPEMTICNCDFSSIQDDEAKQANAALIVEAVNQHAALVAVAEALQGIAPKLARWKSTGIEAGKMGKDCNFEQLQSLVEKTLANLTTVREGGAK